MSYIQLMFYMALISSRDFGIWPHGAVWRDHFHFEDSAQALAGSSAVDFAFHMINPALFPLALPRQPSHTPFTINEERIIVFYRRAIRAIRDTLSVTHFRLS